MNWIGEHLHSFALEKQDDIAINFSGRVILWQTLYNFVECVADYLSFKTPEGGRVGISLPNSPMLLIIVLGAARSGRIAVIYDTEWPKSMRDSLYLKTTPNILISSNPEDNPSILIANPDSFSCDLFTLPEFKKSQNLKFPNPLLPFYIGFTSGTTGVAKGFVRTQKSWIESFKSLNQDIKINDEKGAIILGSFAHSIHLYAALEALHFGIQISFLKKFKPSSILKIMLDNSSSLVYATPSQLLLLVKFSTDHPEKKQLSVKTIITGGSKWNQGDTESLLNFFPNAALVEFYGTSEMSFVSISLPNEFPPEDSVGRAIKGVSICIRDCQNKRVSQGAIGKIWVQSELIFNSYVCGTNKDFQRDNDWITVGDFGRIDELGFLYLTGRKDRMFNVLGKNVYPEKIEKTLLSQKDIIQAAVFGLDDNLRGEKVIAVIQVKKGASLNINELKVVCRSKLLKHEVPRVFQIIFEWPMLSSGKTDLKSLQHLAKKFCLEK